MRSLSREGGVAERNLIHARARDDSQQQPLFKLPSQDGVKGDVGHLCLLFVGKHGIADSLHVGLLTACSGEEGIPPAPVVAGGISNDVTPFSNKFTKTRLRNFNYFFNNMSEA